MAAASETALALPAPSIREIKSILTAAGIAHEHCIEKSELVALLQRVLAQ